MSTNTNSLMGQVRSLLHEPHPDAAAVIHLIKSFDDVQARMAAEQYALDHFLRIKEREGIRDYQPFKGGMIQYDPVSGILRDTEGVVLKEMCCPLQKRWEQLKPLSPDEQVRFCQECQRKVHNTSKLNTPDLRELLRDEPDLCLHIAPQHGNVTFISTSLGSSSTDESGHVPRPGHALEKRGLLGRLRSWLGGELRRTTASEMAEESKASGESGSPEVPELVEQIEPSGPPHILTSFNLAEINAAVVTGHRLVLHRYVLGKVNPDLFIQVWQNKRTRQIAVQTDRRHVPLPLPYQEWEVAIPGFYTSSQCEDGAFAAYLIPETLKPNTRVYLPLAIHKSFSRRSKSSTSLTSAHGHWNGSDIILEASDLDFEDYMIVG